MSTTTTSTRTCFVIGPIGDRHAEPDSPERRAYEEALDTYEKIILPACAKHGIHSLRADEIAQTGEITEQIHRHLVNDDIVIADVTGGNPNVMYELGIRHLLGKPTVHVGEAGELPFDIAPIRTITFKRTRSGIVDARNELAETLARGIQDGFDLFSPARILLAMRATEQAPGPDAEPDAEAEADDDAHGLMDRFAQVEEQMGAMQADMEEITGSIQLIGEKSKGFGPDFERLSQSGSSMSEYLTVAKRYALAITEPSARLKAVVERFAGRMADIDVAMNAALDFLQAVPPELRGEEDRKFLLDIIGMSAEAAGYAESLRDVGSKITRLTTMSRQLRGPGRDIITALSDFGDALERVAQWERRARTLL
ncbi:hypothetical protein [Streptomyces sp. 6N223]|uniref:hypothetical protein n=1 Tax=Streptomyces sp. 6N223 TaxID=3457412 RepID=UPI003FD2B1E9